MHRVFAIVSLLLAVALSAGAQIIDSASQPPPTSGPYAYNTYVPPNAPGASYVDPIFGSTIRRLTTDHRESAIYARNMWWNADGTRFWHVASGIIINTATGATEYASMPRGELYGNSGFDPVDPDVYFYWTSATIRKVTLRAGGTYADELYFTAPSKLLQLGESINWLDANGRFMLVRYGSEPSVRVFDRQNLGSGPYANAIDGAVIDRGGFAGLTPDGNYAVTNKQAWRIDHSTNTVSTSPTAFWDLCGSHGSFASASDGRNYWISSDCVTGPLIEFWRVDITNNVAGQPPATQKAAPNNRLLLRVSPDTVGSHVTTVAKGTQRDWAFYSIECPTDVFDGAVGSWTPYMSEIVAINVVTLEVRRLAHHRSRSINMHYSSEPRVSTSWTGNIVAWASNFNRRGVVDVFAVPFSSGPVLSTPRNFRLVPP